MRSPWLRRETWTRENLRSARPGGPPATSPQPGAPRRPAGRARRDVAGHPWRRRLARHRHRSRPEGPFRVSIVEAGTLQALRSVTYASTHPEQPGQDRGPRPRGQARAEGRPARSCSTPRPSRRRSGGTRPFSPQAEADLQKARQDIKLQAIQNQEELARRPPQGGAERARAARRAGRQGPAQGGGGARPRWPTPSATSRRRRPRSRT